MPKTSKGVPVDLSAQMRETAVEHARDSKSGDLVPVPGGKFIPIEEFMVQGFRPENLSSEWADPERHLTHPRPECKYVWKSIDKGYQGEQTARGVRMGKYRFVSIDELKTDVDLPLARAKDPTGGDNEVLVVRGIALVEVQPKAVAEEYKYREQLAAQRTVRNLGETMMRNSLPQRLIESGAVKVETVGD